LRCFNELVRVKISHIDQVAITANAAQAPTTPAAKPQVTEEQKEEQRLVAHSAALTTIIQRKKIPALTTYLKEHNLSPDFPLHPVSTYSHAATLLHFASSSSIPSMVSVLLSLGANPEATNAAGKTPFEVAGDRQTRDRFRLARHTLGESKWNWERACVPKPLTEQAVEERGQQEQADLAKERAKKAAETKRIAKEALASSTKSGRGVGIPLAGNVANDRGLTMEMRTKVERERRARAAEARFAGLAKKP
jgi:ankyrin repeat and zinc finger domain-containing protein 1